MLNPPLSGLSAVSESKLACFIPPMLGPFLLAIDGFGSGKRGVVGSSLVIKEQAAYNRKVVMVMNGVMCIYRRSKLHASVGNYNIYL